jgi:3-oxoadipate enol-lactonase
LHPLAASRSIWDLQTPVLAQRFDLVRIDLPGHGNSPLVESGLAAFAESVLATLEKAGIERAAVLGMSLGGMVAQAIAVAAPRRITRLILAHTSAQSTAPARALWQQRLEAVAAAGMDSQIDGTLGRWFTESFRTSAPMTMAWIASMIRATSVEGFGSAVRAIQGLDLLCVLDQVRAPTLVLAGALDQATTVAQAETIARAIPGAQLEVLPDVAHVSNVQQPTVFSECIGAFLAPL